MTALAVIPARLTVLESGIPWSIAEVTGLLEDEVPHQFGIHGVLEERQRWCFCARYAALEYSLIRP